MDVESARLIAASIAVFPLFGVALGIGYIFANFISAIARNPKVRDQAFSATVLGFAVVESSGLFALLIAFLILFL